jgi:hypothetical protein
MPNPYLDAANALTQMGGAYEALIKQIEHFEQQLSQETLRTGNLSGPGGVFSHNTPSPAALDLDRKLRVYRTYREKHLEWGRKIHGVMMGYVREATTAHKNLAKDRVVGFTLADVTVGTNQLTAKAVQHKHTVSPENSAVNEMIAKAANQLTGESGETPLAEQRKVIDVMINDPQNWWPFDNAELSTLPLEGNLAEGIIPISLFRSRAERQIITQLAKYKQGKSGLNAQTINSLDNFNQPPAFHHLKKSSVAYTTPTHTARAAVLTVKIIYGQPRKFKNISNGDVTVRKAVFYVYKQNNNLTVRFEQAF